MEELLKPLQEAQTIALVSGLILLLTWESIHPFYGFFTGSQSKRGLHAFRNLFIGALNAVLIATLFVGLWLAASLIAAEYRTGLMHWLEDALRLPVWVHALGAIILLDLWMYLWHRINHVVPFFWRFHRVHHSDPHMDVTTASRFHIGEIFFSSVFRIPLIILFGVYLWELVLYETIMFAVVQFHHADIRLPEKVDRVLRWVIVTPSMHRVHHSRWQPETDSNYSSLFSFWDRLYRTFRINPDPLKIRLGLKEFDGETDQTIRGLFRTPLKKKS